MCLAKLTIRRFGTGDSISELTLLLNRAYATLAELGLRYTATYQGDAITRDRIAKGVCYLAEINKILVGTITYYPPAALTFQYYGDRPEDAVFGQLGVDPEFRERGIGKELIAQVEAAAQKDGASAISLDTAIPATHLIRWYEKLGYSIVDEADWDSTNYRSYIMRKEL